MPSVERTKLQRTPSNPIVRKRKGGRETSEFFERDLVLIEEDLSPATSPVMSTRRRMDNEDGPWAVSVAEDAKAYSLYVKTPTHNLTLARTALEIVELDTKLRDGDFGVLPPPLPLSPAVVSASTPKRKSNFLNTLSRLASPTSKRATQMDEPITASAFDALPSPSATSTALAAYFTTISNTPNFRTARPWKRFVRVRTEDLESVRVERAIKRVRSDLAAHQRDEKPVPDIPEEHTVKEAEEVESTQAKDELEEPKTPSASTDPTRARSQSADPDKRISRAFGPPSSEILSEMEPETETGDESSAAASSSTSPASPSPLDAASNGGRRVKIKKKVVPKPKKSSRKVVIDDFEMLRVLGKGCAGKVLLVRYKPSGDLYALKAITKRHVLAHQELQHTLTEQAVLKKLAAARERDPFVVKLWWSFHDKENLFLVMDFHPGGDLATQLARWGRLGRDRARFYAAEIVEGVEGLHAQGVIYRDLKPENILIGADGHIVLTDFGLSKEFPGRKGALTAPPTPNGTRGGEYFSGPSGTSGTTTPPWMKPDKNGELALGWPAPLNNTGSDTTTTFCGTAEYLAPEVIKGLPYSYEIDWWSFGTMLFEMLTGITPFWASNHSEMYIRVLNDELTFPDDRTLDQDTKSLIRGLLQRNPALRICEPRIKRHPYFSMIDWSHVYYKRYIPPYIPPIDPSNASDTQNFDDTFLDMEPVLNDEDEDIEGTHTDTDRDGDAENTDTDRESNTTPSQSRSSSAVRKENVNKEVAEEDSVDVFDGYSYKGRHSVILDEEEEEEEGEEGEEEEEVEEEEGEEVAEVEVEQREDDLVAETPTPGADEDEEQEPKTPEARPVVLPPEESVLEPVSEPVPESVPEPEREPEPEVETVVEERASVTPEPLSKPTEIEEVPIVAPPPLPEKQVTPPPKTTKPPTTTTATTTTTTKAPVPPPKGKLTRPRREKSGVPALDRYLSDTNVDEDADTGVPSRDGDEDDDWDFIDAVDGEDRNGAKGTSLFARGVVDRYRLAVFKKGSVRTFSGVSESEAEESPSRGRNAGLTFRRHPRQFLRPRTSRQSSHTGVSTVTSSTASPASNAPSLSTASSGFLVPSSTSASLGTGSVSSPGSPSLRSKESAISVGAQSSSDGDAVATDIGTISRGEEPEKLHKNKKLKKYKENAEKVFSIFSGSSPKQQQQHAHQQ